MPGRSPRSTRCWPGRCSFDRGTARFALALALFTVTLTSQAQDPWLPQDLTYTLEGGEGLLSWSPVSEADGYLIHRDGEQIDGTRLTQFLVPGFDDRFAYQVAACFGLRCLELSQPARPAAPEPPDEPIVTHASPPPDEMLGYQVRAARDSDEIARLRRMLIAADIDPDSGR